MEKIFIIKSNYVHKYTSLTNYCTNFVFIIFHAKLHFLIINYNMPKFFLIYNLLLPWKILLLSYELLNLTNYITLSFKNCIEIINRIFLFTEILKRENIELVIYIYRLVRDIRKINYIKFNYQRCKEKEFLFFKFFRL